MNTRSCNAVSSLRSCLSAAALAALMLAVPAASAQAPADAAPSKVAASVLRTLDRLELEAAGIPARGARAAADLSAFSDGLVRVRPSGDCRYSSLRRWRSG